jgi:hypothetical protein
MTTKEILQKESTKGETNVLLLFREGIFLKAYEESAYLFYRFVKNYEVKTVYYKNIGRNLLSLGFPSHYLQVIVNNSQLTLQEDTVQNLYRLTSDTFHFSEDEFLLFKKEHTSLSPVHLSRKKPEKENPDVIARLQQFDIAGSTPMECMLFLNELKRLLHDQSLQIQ